ncbi:DUF1993 domain-containing protein [Bradyrhizobium sp. SYSU BS000235]|uniref:DUF1993 domain-containing protein n=1 Tax=Bradyrhizobium sp. SYSU BS000235 TaxID=3411332 RepID=UPI003C744FE7
MSFYDGSAPLFIHTLTALSKILTKAEAYAKDKNIDPAVLLNARLSPTMYPLTKQIQLACDFSGKACARFSQTELPVMADNETTFEELQARIAKVIGNIKALPAEKYQGGEAREITYPVGQDKTVTVTGQQFLNHAALPNFFFHCVTAYDILRHNGVEVGKRDFLGIS